MQKFLVVSYDDDQQQWFWDFVAASSADVATNRICMDRPYVIAANAISAHELTKLTGRLRRTALHKISINYKRTIKEA